jgi:hypothetical protein
MKIARFSLPVVLGLVLCACAAPAASQSTPTVIPTLEPTITTPPIQPTAKLPNEAEAIANIRKFLGKPDLALTLTGPINLANSPDGDLTTWLYTDDHGRMYWVEVDTNRLLEVDPPSGYIHATHALYSEAELKTQAEKIMTENMPEFLNLKSSLSFQAATKDGSIYFFRWEDAQATGFKMNRPFAQVALAIDGMLVSYYNMLGLK